MRADLLDVDAVLLARPPLPLLLLLLLESDVILLEEVPNSRGSIFPSHCSCYK